MDNEFLKRIGQQAEPRQRFIRTFLTDSATVKEGGVPDFTPVIIEEENIGAAIDPGIGTQEPLEKPEPAPPSPPTARAVEPELPKPAPPAPTIELPPPPLPSPPPAPPPVAKEQPSPIHTFSTDFSDRIKETKASTATILAAEGDATPKPNTPVPVRSTATLYVISGLLLLLFGVGSIYGVYVYLQREPGPVIFGSTAPTPIFVDEREELSGMRSELRAAIVQSIQKPLETNTVRLLYTKTATTTGNTVFHALALPAPDILLRNIQSEGSMAGVSNAGGVTAPFFILHVTSYADTFAGMLSWESHMTKDLASFFSPRGSTEAIATSTSGGAIPTLFKDEIVSNRDTRILRGTNGETTLLYGYWNPAVLIIAQNEDAFRLIIERLNTSKTQQ